MDKIKNIGKDAMIIKVVDFCENIPFAKLIKHDQYLQEIEWKHNFAMGEMKPYIGELQIFKDCHSAHQKLFKKNESS